MRLRTGTTCLQCSLLWTRVNAIVRVCEVAYWKNSLAVQFTVDTCQRGSKSV